MGEIDVPFMGRNVGAFGQITEIAEIALVDNFSIVGYGDAVHFHGLALVHQIEQGRERIAKTDAATAAMANVINSLEFVVKISLIPEFGIVLVQRVSGRCFQSTFSA